MPIRLTASCIALTSLLTLTHASAAAASDLSELLRHAAEYVRRYHETLTTVVAEELYRQSVIRPDQDRSVRTLRSEFALVRGAPDEELWLAVRDVVEVDGQPVQGSARLNALLRGSRGSLRASARAIAEEQAKYNLGGIYRTINVPTLPLEFLLPDRQPRFRFKDSGTSAAAGVEVRAVNYEERARPTIIRTPNGGDVVARGTLWVDPASGRVLKTELDTPGPRGMRVNIAVDYALEPRLQMLVPVTMRETYRGRDIEISAVATYSNFRRFEAESRIVR
jgi:hypothetical protein